MSLRMSLIVTAAALAMAASTAFAAPQAASPATAPAATAATAPVAKKLSSQQQRMVDCNKQATGKKGAERKTFMSGCLKGESAAAPAAATAAAAPASKQTQQEKMKSCNADAKTKTLKGAARKTFMSSCLKSDAAPASP